MQKPMERALKKERHVSDSLASDLKYLFKGPVLIANVLPVFAGFWLAIYFYGGTFAEYISLFFLTMAGSTMLMAGALTLNNWYEVDLDRVMARTQMRPTVTGNISMATILKIGIVLSVAGILMLYAASPAAAIYGFIGWFTYVVLYTMWSKRKYTLNTVIGSVSGAVTPLIGWAAVGPSYHMVPIVLAIVLFIWQMPHTFAIAIKKVDEYRAAGVAMLPVVKGIPMTKRQSIVYSACLLPLPFFLAAFGTGFIVLATLMNVGFLALSLAGLFMKDDYKWAHWMFLYSVNYMTIFFMSMILMTTSIL